MDFGTLVSSRTDTDDGAGRESAAAAEQAMHHDDFQQHTVAQ
jgi:hypothetical protein